MFSVCGGIVFGSTLMGTSGGEEGEGGIVEGARGGGWVASFSGAADAAGACCAVATFEGLPSVGLAIALCILLGFMISMSFHAPPWTGPGGAEDRGLGVVGEAAVATFLFLFVITLIGVIGGGVGLLTVCGVVGAVGGIVGF